MVWSGGSKAEIITGRFSLIYSKEHWQAKTKQTTTTKKKTHKKLFIKENQMLEEDEIKHRTVK